MHHPSPLRCLTLLAPLTLLLALLLHPLSPTTPAQAQPTTSGWTAITLPTGVTAPAITSLTLTPDDAARAFLATASGVYTSSDAGASWMRLTALITPTTALVIAPSDEQRVYAWGSALSRSDDGGATWSAATSPDSLCELVVAPETADRLYARSCSGSPALYRSDDGGQSWSSPAPAFTSTLSGLVALQGNVLVGTDGSAVYRSADSGATWSAAPIGSGITGATLAADASSNTVYVGYANGLLRSADGGQTWQNSDIERAVTLLIAAPFRPNTAIAGTAINAWQIASDTQGWTATAADLPASPRMLVRSIRDTHLLYVLTNSSLWRRASPAAPPVGAVNYLPIMLGAPAASGTSGSAAEQAISYLNTYRTQAGAPPLHLHAALVTAAQNHATYDLLNHGNPSAWTYGPHGEVAGKPGFTGQFPGDRAVAAQYPWSAGWEVMDYFGDPVRSVDAWLGTVFHRTGALNPSLHYAGYANGRTMTELVDVLDIARGPADIGMWLPALPFVLAYPSGGQTDVPLYAVPETPSAVPPGATYPIGYPVTIQVGRGTTLSVSLAELRDGAGHLVTVHPNPAGCGTACYAMIPVAGLSPATLYTAHTVGTVDGIVFDRTWSFTTTACTTPGFC